MPISQALDHAYESPDGIWIQSDTAYIAGTRLGWPFDSATDHWDWPRNVYIPLGTVESLPRYEKLQQYLSLYPEINHLVGHSMGGSVALVAARNNPALTAKTYGAPNISLPWQGGDRHRDIFDPISILDTGAEWDGGISKPHSYAWADN